MAKKLFDYQLDETVDGYFLLKDSEVRIAKNGKKFLAINFQDTSGEISAKFWDASDQDVDHFQAGRVVHLHGKRENYQGNPQIKIQQMRLTHAGEPQDVQQFVEHAPLNSDTMQEAINQYVFAITEPNWNRIVRRLLTKYHDDFFNYPAAKKNHHAFAGGLAYHTLSILKLAQAVSEQYPHVNRALLYAGAILHDMGKTIEMSGPVSTTYTLAGNLVGHIVLIDEQIVEACQQLKIDEQSESVLLLRHMILAHHGLLEYGSPVRPHIMEAEILHDLDELDASIQMMQTSIGHAEPGTYTERIFAMDGRNFYRPLHDATKGDQPEQGD
ncbi:3'-5' exoribonuclease YhaM family protein [Lactiplantibacillus modestisalitolerans]|uniref:3'-5' exoribonuclease YhaM family protein n=1 Tax=Lactiplantibacillus modestisalitolerans TaxID=1457219 RepID=A0ABV5WV39_9LACO|nr:HD domain-containing protein [Lactiplantibacillus modestisalitolerans]